jgi:hypothetical protein
MEPLTIARRLGFLVLLGILSGCSPACRNRVVARAQAPDGAHRAVLFQRDCGATTGFSTQISVLRAGEDPGAGGNAFIADSGGGAARAGSWGGPWAEVRWLSARHLLIRYAAGARLFVRADEVAGIQISYEPVAVRP